MALLNLSRGIILRSVTASRRAFATQAAPGGCLERYLRMKKTGDIQEDPRQEVCMKMLDDLAKDIVNYTPRRARCLPSAAPQPAASASSHSGGMFSSFFGASKPATASKPQSQPPRGELMPAPGQAGLYLWGGTGTGKTFMMNMFYDQVQVKEKKRIHFHEWMIDVHTRMHRKQKGSSADTSQTSDDMIEQVAADMLSEAWLLCFDEFQVTHISDAVIMKRIFEVLFERGAVVVATSNRPPEDLYKNGLNRPLFVPFIPMLQKFCKVHNIKGDQDYRMESEKGDDPVYITPDGEEEQAFLQRKFNEMCRGRVVTGTEVEVQGRRIQVPKRAEDGEVAFFSFSELCDRPLGAADYLAIGEAFSTLFIAGIPQLTMQERDQVRRMITLIDSLYEMQVKLFCTAAADPMKLFSVSQEERAGSHADEIFAFDRTVSRLTEMMSEPYLKAERRPREQGR
mmetsp:Transcript_34637/g.80875  ORF Transcript_34637/g.80875 Transcript_34637/m.80875 type:complete len:454 (-) Transcript_34637:227-1588(-)